MSKNLILLLLLVCLGSCYNENKPVVETPALLLSEETVISILTDLQLAEAVIAKNRLGKVNVTAGFKDSVYQVVFDHYGITASQLEENLDYYNTDIENMEKMYDEVLVNLSKKETEIQLEGKVPDSVAVSIEEED